MSEAIGAYLAGWRNILAIEISAEYAEIGQARFDWWRWAADLSGLSDPAAILKQYGKKGKGRQDLPEHLPSESPYQTHEGESYDEHVACTQGRLL